MKSNRSIFRFLTLIIIGSLAIACQNKPSSTLGSDVPGEKSPFDGDFNSDLNNSLAGNGNTNGTVGSGPSGNLTDADKAAIQGMTKELESVNTPEGALSQDLIDEAKRILDAENNTDGDAEKNAQIQQAKMALVGKIVEQCAEKVGPLAPIPGQPLMGVWKGGGACPVEFTVASAGASPVYTVTGGTKGKMGASAEGTGSVQAEPFSGSLTDSPTAGTGSLRHPTFHKTKEGEKPCDVGVSLATSSNPIPENYIKAMKMLGKCHRQALLFMSPVMDKMFKNMPQNLSSLLLNRGIGVSR